MLSLSVKFVKSPGKPKMVPEINYDDYKRLPITLKSTIQTLRSRNKIGIVNETHFRVHSYFDYQHEILRLTFISGHRVFIPIEASLSFKKKDVSCIRYSSHDPIKCEQPFVTQLAFDNCNIDFFGDSDDRILSINFNYEISGLSGYSFNSVFTITLPEIRTTMLITNSPKTIHPPKEIRRICKCEFQMDENNTREEINLCLELEIFRKLNILQRYQECGYLRMLKTYLNIENSFEQDLADKCAFSDANLIKLNELNFRIMTPWPITNQIDKVLLTAMDDFNNNNGDQNKFKIVAWIINFEPESIIVELEDQKKVSKVDITKRYTVKLLPNFFSSSMAFMALDNIKKQKFENFLVNFDARSLPVVTENAFVKVKNFDWFNVSVGSNEAQSSAIKHIVNRTNFPAPYVIFGPPGTGKTSTLVEAVAQIVENYPFARTIITVNSNSACDEIGDRLLKYVGHNKVYRYYSPSFERKKGRVHPKLRSCSNLRYGYHIQPSIQEMESYNVVICTLVNSGRLIIDIPASYFDFVIIDECASSAEAYVAIPLSLTMSKREKFNASIVLAGDHKQLGQIMRTHYSERYGFNISMMERVMEMPNYKFHEEYGYNPNFITQLTDNFRSHEAILDFSNKNFYNSILKAKQDAQIANFALGWEKLPNRNVPLIFQASWAPSEMDGTSHYNNGEIAFVKKYVRWMVNEGINGKKISAKNIGIISPYAIHREKLKVALPPGVEIGTVEYFQGREKLIIILSCVRSKTRTIGFLNNEKRLNVALTRAKGLLIVVANPETLGKNKMWRRFITSCALINAKVGKIPNWVCKRGKKEMEEDDVDSDEVVRLEEFMNGYAVED